MSTTSEMRIRDFEVWVNLGCSREEQSVKQPVSYQVNIEFFSVVAGEVTDHLNDAIDYVELMNRLKIQSEKKSYHLIEHMCSEATKDLKEYLKSRGVRGQLTVQLLKKRVPVSNLVVGAEWICRTPL